MKAVRRIADTGRSVLCTIHQPSAELFYMFDRLLLLRSGGEVTYFSNIGQHGAELVHYFEKVSAGAAPKLPFGINPANWMLDIIQSGIQTEEGGSIQSEGFEGRDYAALWKKSEQHSRAQEETDLAAQPADQSHDVESHVAQQKYVGTAVRLEEVVKRYFVMHWRNAPTNLTRIALLLIMGLLLGLIYQDTTVGDFSGVQAKLSVIFLGLAFPASISASSALPSLFRQRAVYYRESTINMYGYGIYSTGITIVELVYIFFSLAFFILPYYFLVGLANDGSLFWRYYLVVYTMGVCYSFLSQLWMAACSTTISSNVVNGFFMSLFFMFGGVFIQASKIPQGWKWFYYIDPIPKALIAGAMPQFYCNTDGLNPTSNTGGCPTITPPNGNTQFVYNYVRDNIEGSNSQYWPMIGWLILTIFVIRILNLLALRFISHLKR
jgi:hypothetical protein